jgi:hypothetical protein
MQLFACFGGGGPRIRPTSNFVVDSPDLGGLCSSLPMIEVLLIGSEIAFNSFDSSILMNNSWSGQGEGGVF